MSAPLNRNTFNERPASFGNVLVPSAPPAFQGGESLNRNTFNARPASFGNVLVPSAPPLFQGGERLNRNTFNARPASYGNVLASPRSVVPVYLPPNPRLVSPAPAVIVAPRPAPVFVPAWRPWGSVTVLT